MGYSLFRCSNASFSLGSFAHWPPVTSRDLLSVSLCLPERSLKDVTDQRWQVLKVLCLSLLNGNTYVMWIKFKTNRRISQNVLPMVLLFEKSDTKWLNNILRLCCNYWRHFWSTFLEENITRGNVAETLLCSHQIPFPFPSSHTARQYFPMSPAIR